MGKKALIFFLFIVLGSGVAVSEDIPEEFYSPPPICPKPFDISNYLMDPNVNIIIQLGIRIPSGIDDPESNSFMMSEVFDMSKLDGPLYFDLRRDYSPPAPPAPGTSVASDVLAGLASGTLIPTVSNTVGGAPGVIVGFDSRMQLHPGNVDKALKSTFNFSGTTAPSNDSVRQFAVFNILAGAMTPAARQRLGILKFVRLDSNNRITGMVFENASFERPNETTTFCSTHPNENLRMYFSAR